MATAQGEGVQYCVNCEVVECTEMLCDGCLNEVVEDMYIQWSEQVSVDVGLY